MKKRRKKNKQKSVVHYNEYDSDPRRQYLAEVRRKKAKRRQRFILSALIVLLIIAYFVSPLSRIQSISIEGNANLTKEEILTTISDQTNGYFLFTNTNKIEKILKKQALIKKCRVSRTLLGGLEITIEEARPVAYAVFKNQIYVIDEEGKMAQTNDTSLQKKLESKPRIIEFNSLSQIKKLAKQYVTLPYLLRNSVSDIIFSPQKADPTRVRFVMDDGKQLIVRLEDISKVLSKDKFDYDAYMTEYKDACTFSFEGSSIYISGC